MLFYDIECWWMTGVHENRAGIQPVGGNVFLQMAPATHHFIIVDDEEDIRFLIRRVIARLYVSARIFEAANGQEALKLYESHGADLMIIDHQIPLLDGLSLVRYLRAQNVTIPMVMISNNPQIEEVAVSAGATRFMDKHDFFKSLETLLPTWLA